MYGRPLNVGVIGAGWWATSAHIPALVDHPRARLLAVNCRSLDKADRVARDFSVPHALTNVEKLLDLKELDAVVISTTPNVHYEQAKAALERGKHVLLEKPMTFTAAEASELCDLAKANSLQLLISCPWHYTAHGRQARELIHGGALGRIHMISVLMTNPVDKLLKGINTTPTHGMENVYMEPNAGSYNDPAIAGGGQIFCQVSHAAAYLTYLTGASPRRVFACFDFDGSPNDIYNVLLVEMERELNVSLASTCATPLAERNYEVRIYGSTGILLMELWKGSMEHVPFEGERHCYASLGGGEIYPDRAPVINFIEACLGLEPNLSPGELGLASMQIIEASCRSARSSQPVAIADL